MTSSRRGWDFLVIRGICMIWLIFQSSIIFAVVASNIHWRWTPNGYLAAILGAGLFNAANM